MTHTWFLTLVLSISVSAGKLPFDEKPGKETSSYSNVDELKMQRRFGLGMSAGGPLSVLGLEVDVNIEPEWGVSLGIGTGLDYSTMMAKTRFFLPGQWVSPYLTAGIARWWSNGTKEKVLGPSILRNKFLPGESDFTNGFDVWIVYPGIGVQFMHSLGFAFYAEVQYLFKLFNLANGTYAGLGMHWYF